MNVRTRLIDDAVVVLDMLVSALNAETNEARARTDELLRHGSPKELEGRGALLRKAVVRDVRPGLLERARLSIGDDPQRQGHVDAFSARVGAAVHVVDRDDDGKPAIIGHGIILRRRRGMLEVVIDGKDIGDIDVGDPISLMIGADEVSLRRLMGGVQAAKVMTGRPARLVEHLVGVVSPRPTRHPNVDDGSGPLVKLGVASRLNPDQLRAASHALFAEDVALVHGPPGTGKTHVLVEVVRAAVARGDRVLCAAASNAAVDHLALSLLRADGSLALTRVGDPARVHEDLEAHTLAVLTANHPHQEQARRLLDQAQKLLRGARRRSDTSREARQREREARTEARQLFAEARQLEAVAAADVVNKTRVVCATLTGRLYDIADKNGAPFDLLVIDEASQATTPALLLPLPYLSSTGRVVMAGDHLQLPPVVVSAGAKALEQTAFSTLRQRDTKGAADVDGDGSGDYSHMLTVQHRMHATLMAFPSQHTYDGRLTAHPSVAERTLTTTGIAASSVEAGARCLPERVLDVIDTAGASFDEARSDGGSYENAGEAAVVALLVDDLIACGVAQSDVGVITPYSAQSTRLQRLLSSHIDGGLEVDSVDGFQGREKRVIVFSAVRSNTEQQVGFLADARRQNVAITRAQHKLIVVGDSSTLSTDPHWRGLFDHAIASADHGAAYRSVFEIDGAV
jgi:predicted DNA helicase